MRHLLTYLRASRTQMFNICVLVSVLVGLSCHSSHDKAPVQETRLRYKHAVGTPYAPCASEKQVRDYVDGQWHPWHGPTTLSEDSDFKVDHCQDFTREVARFQIEDINTNFLFPTNHFSPRNFGFFTNQLWALNDKTGIIHINLNNPEQPEEQPLLPLNMDDKVNYSITQKHQQLLFLDNYAYVFTSYSYPDAREPRLVTGSWLTVIDLKYPDHPRISPKLDFPGEDFASYTWTNYPNAYIFAVNPTTQELLAFKLQQQLTPEVRKITPELRRYKIPLAKPDDQYLSQVAVKDHYLYLARKVTSNNTLQIQPVDISEPAYPVIMTYDLYTSTSMNEPVGMLVQGNYLYLLGKKERADQTQPQQILLTLDLTNPRQLPLGHTFNLEQVSTNFSFTAQDGFAYIHDLLSLEPPPLRAKIYARQLTTLDVHTPDSPELLQKTTLLPDKPADKPDKFLLPLHFAPDYLYFLEYAQKDRQHQILNLVVWAP